MQENAVTWYLGNALLLNLVAPKDFYPDPSTPVVLDAAETIEAHLFSKRVKSTTTKDEVQAALTVTLEKVSDFAVGDTITLEEADGNFTRHPVTDVDSATNIVTFTTGINAAGGMKLGARVWKTYGTVVVTGVFYGSASLSEIKWGYVYAFPHTYDTAIRRTESLEAMAVLDKNSTGAHYTRTWDVIIAEPLGSP